MKKQKSKKINYNKKIKNKTYRFFAVVNKDTIKNEQCNIVGNSKFYTITDNYYECQEYIYAREVADHMPHYTLWCELKGLNPNDTLVWESYRELVLNNNSDYAIISFEMCWKDVVGIIRMFQGCFPIGCSFDRQMEINFFHKQILQDKIKQAVKETKEEKENKVINPEDIVQ